MSAMISAKIERDLQFLNHISPPSLLSSQAQSLQLTLASHHSQDQCINKDSLDSDHGGPILLYGLPEELQNNSILTQGHPFKILTYLVWYVRGQESCPLNPANPHRKK